MKKLLFAAILVASFGVANAQTEQGGWLVGAGSNLSFNSFSVDGVDDNLTTLNFNPRVGYFIMDGLSAGLSVDITSIKQGDDKLSSTGFGPFVRYYVGGQFFVGLGYNILSQKVDDNDSVSGGEIALEAGYPIFLGDNVAIEPALNYSLGSGDLRKDSSEFGLSVGFMLYF